MSWYLMNTKDKPKLLNIVLFMIIYKTDRL